MKAKIREVLDYINKHQFEGRDSFELVDTACAEAADSFDEYCTLVNIIWSRDYEI